MSIASFIMILLYSLPKTGSTLAFGQASIVRQDSYI